MKLLPRLADEEELDREDLIQTSQAEPPSAPVPRRWLAGMVTLAAVTRLGYLFLFNTPQNAGDSATDAYHHWQIAYLTKEIGLSHGPRLWDMRGWEYVWGPLHPLLMDLLFFATGSVDLVLARLLSLTFGLLAVGLIFALCHRHWGLGVAVPATLFAALSPVSVFNDVAGMAEPLAIGLVLLGIWLAPRHGFWAGVAWAVAATARVEAWPLGAGLVVAWLVGTRRTRLSRAPMVIGWGLGMSAYALWLLGQTGNPIYPFYVGFLFTGLAAGGTGGSASPDVGLWIAFVAAGLLALGAAAWSTWRRPPGFLLLSYGFGYSALSLATYARYVSEWKERRFELPLDFAAILIAILLVRVLPERWPGIRSASWAAAAAALVAVQALWLPVQSAYAATQPSYEHSVALAHSIGAVYNQPAYRGGVLNMPGDEPTVLYLLVRDEGLRGSNVTSQFYDPFHYLPAGYRYVDHRDVAGPLLQCWLSQTHTALWLISPPGPLSATNEDYRAFMSDHPDWFADASLSMPSGWSLFGVRVPAPAAGECATAARAAPPA